MVRQILKTSGMAVLLLAAPLACHPRGTVADEDREQKDSEDPGVPSEIKTEGTADAGITEDPNALPKEEPKDIPPLTNEPPVVPAQNQGQTARIEALSFQHAQTLCLTAHADGKTSQETCDAKGVGQKFLFTRAQDGRVQLKEQSTQLCLVVGSGSLFGNTELKAETCEAKATQFFSIIDYATSYSLRYDGSNSCFDVEQARQTIGTRILLYRCTGDPNQKILIKKN